MIPQCREFEPFVFCRRLRCLRSPTRLPNYHPSTLLDKPVAGKIFQYLRAHVVCPRRVDEHYAKSTIRRPELGKRAENVDADDRAALGETEIFEILSNRRGCLARRIDKRCASCTARQRFDTERAAAGKNVENVDAFEVKARRDCRKNRRSSPRRRGTGFQTARRLDSSAVGFSGNYSQGWFRLYYALKASIAR